LSSAVSVRRATVRDTEFASQDGQLDREVVGQKIAANEVLIADIGGYPRGFARIEYLWSKVPYVGLIFVLPEHRRQGVGRALLASLETRFAAEGHEAFYSSSQANEPEPQAWHRHMGFLQCGAIAGVNPGNVGEVFFRKALGAVPSNDSDLETRIRALELRLLDPEVRSSAEEMTRLLADDFLEFGASGRMFDKALIVGSVSREEPVEFSVADFEVRLLAPEIALATYRLCSRTLAGESRRFSLRSSLWIRAGDRWLLRFHQGTLTDTAR
jgi:GNAT superfamily N-acetyltransferase